MAQMKNQAQKMASKLTQKTADAFSYDRYGEVGWSRAAELLLTMGLPVDDVEWVLRSKYMRWAGDEFESNGGYGNQIGDEIVKFAHKYGIKDDGGRVLVVKEVRS